MMNARLRCIALALSLSLAAPTFAAGNGTATLNLKDADIRVLIDTVSEITGRNFIIDPRVKAKVTVVSAKPMNADEIYEIFNSILQVHGFAAVDTGDVTKIVPDVSAKQGPVPTVTRSSNNRVSGDQIVTRVIPILNVPAAQLVPILRPLIPQQGQLAAYQPSNVLLISDRASNINRLVDIIEKIDRPDQSDIEIIALSHAPAAQVARTMSTLQKSNAKGNAPSLSDPVITADERTNSILISGDKSTRLRLRGIIAHLDTPLESGGDTQVVFLKYAKAEELAPILSGIAASNKKNAQKAASANGQAAAASNVSDDRPVDIQADPSNNALVITGPPSAQQELRQVIAQLDIRRAQVLLEAIIAEVSEDLATELGVQWAVGNSDGSSPVGLTNFGSSNNILQLAQNPYSAGAGMLLGVADITSNGANFGVLLSALKGDAATNILSTPSLMTLDNTEAEIKVGQNVPFITGSFTNTSSNGGSNPFQTIERKDIGLTLKVKPQINEGDAIKLEIEQESSNLASSSAGAADLITNTRSIKTSVMATDGQVIILGGLIDDQFKDNQQKVPGLGDIPLFGNLFRYTSTTKSKQSLMVFIRPVILRDPALTNAYTQEKYSYLQARQIEAKITDRGLIKDSAGILPDLDELITQLPSVEDGFIQQLPRLPEMQ